MQGLKINKLREDLKIKNFCSPNDTIKRVKKITYKLTKIFAIYLTDDELASY